LRIDDLDTPRNVKGADGDILRCLEQFGLHWDGQVYYQSQHLDHYQSILTQLFERQQLYACRCSRKSLEQRPIYPGYCRDAGWPADENSALRLKTCGKHMVFDDALQGHFSQNLAELHGDFIVRRKDQIIAYQFAVVVDDYAQQVNHVVRGADLLDSTTKQLYLQYLLNYRPPDYLHLPVIVDQDGNKLSKQTLAAPVDQQNPSATLFFLLQLLRQDPPTSLQNQPIQEQLQWAIAHWQPQALKKIRAIQLPIH
jgi:glutamyl-Q tRNA(Asp) synthetase